MSEWQDFLVQGTKGDKGVIRAQTLLATFRNFQRRPSDDGTCVDRAVDFSALGLDETTTIRDVKRRAEDWLAASAFRMCSEGGPSEAWTGSR